MSGAGPPASGPTPHVFVDDLDGLLLSPPDHHHLERVLRLRAGDPVTTADGSGRWRPCRFRAGAAALDPVGPVQRVPAPSVPLTVCFALVKGQRPELVVQKLTELGIDRIVPFAAARSVVRWDDDRAAKEAGRLRLVARATAMQSRRCWLPAVDELSTFEAVARFPGAAMADWVGRAPLLATPVVLVGPEGGWSDHERSADLPLVKLGEHVLRAETAALAAAVLLTALRGGLVTQGESP